MLKYLKNTSLLKSLKFRTIFIIGFAIFITFGMMVIYRGLQSRQKAVQTQKAQIINTASSLSKELESKINRTIHISNTLANSFEQVYSIPAEKRRTYIDQTLNKILTKHTDFKAVWAIYELNELDELDSLYADTEFGLLGQFIKCYYRKNNEIYLQERTENDELNLYDAEYYANAKKNNSILITKPFEHSYTNSEVDKITKISIVSPIQRNKKFVGAIGIDIDYSYFQQMLKNKSFENNSTIIIFTQNASAFAHTNPKMLNKSALELFPELTKSYNIETNIQNGTEIIIPFGLNKKDHFMIFSPMTFNEAHVKWSLAYDASISEVIENENIYFFKTLILTFLGFVFVISIVYISSNAISKPIREINKILEKMAIGDFKTEPSIKLYSQEFKRISESLKQLINGLKQTEKFALEIGKGNLDAEFIPLSEKDSLGIALNEMRVNLKTSLEQEKQRRDSDLKTRWSNEGIALFSEILRASTQNVEQLSYEIVSHLVKYLNANQGGLFLYIDNDENHVLELVAAFAFNRQRFEKRTISIGDGLAGTCAQERKTINITNIPEDYVFITSGLGKAKPGNILIVPLLLNDVLYGIIEIASFHKFEKHEIEFVEKIAESIASNISTTKINEQTSRLLEQSQLQSEEMAQKEKELRFNIEKLEETQTQAKYKELEMKGVLDALNYSSLVAEFDINGKLGSINDKYLEILKLDSAEVIHQNHTDFFQIKSNKIKEFVRMWENAKKGKIERTEQKLKVDNSEIWLSSTFTAILDEFGNPTKILNIAYDITEQKIKEQEIQKLIEETQEKAEQMAVQEIEMMQSFEEYENLQNKYKKAISELESFKKESINYENRMAAMQYEMEKRIDKFRKNETVMKEKIHELENELKNRKKE